jgi:tetratricopeptide (TPR) repeat protein
MAVPIEQVDPGVPETLRQMLEIQLQHLSDDERQLLKCVSVGGNRFSAWAVATMLAGDSSTLEGTCEALAERQQFLKRAGTRRLPDGRLSPEYEFRHALYRELLYRWLTVTERATFHRRLAEGLEALYSSVDPELMAALALHFEEGNEAERAVKYLLKAAQNATRRYAHREAIDLLEHARELLPRMPAERAPELDLQILERSGNEYYALGDMTRSAEAYAAMATRAAAVGRLAVQAEALTRMAHTAESIPFFLRAVELDPNLATAYVSLSRIYSNLGEADRARTYAKLAYEHRDHVNERECFSITYQYHFEVTGDQARATQTLEGWKQMFPAEFQPVNSLALIHNFLGRYERAVDEGEEAVRREPAHGFPYSNLAHAYRGLGRFAEARATAERAVALDIETLPTRRLLYQLAVLDGDQPTAIRHAEWARDRSREFDMVGARAQVAGCMGRVREARQLYEESARLAEVRNLADVGTSHLAWATWMEVAYGNTSRAHQEARRVLARNPSYDPRLRAAMTLALAGSASEADVVTEELARASPDHTLINLVLRPIARAAIELGRSQPARALDELHVVAPFELGFIAALAPLFLRGLAYLMLGRGSEAAAEFQRILDHRGSDPFSAFHAVAPLGVARARALAGDVSGSLQAYEMFLAGWTNADPDIPVLLEARDEYDRLQR